MAHAQHCVLCAGRLMHLYAVCVDCLEGVHKIICIKCKSRWDGSWHQLGTMYTYDILAASPCCQVGMASPRERAGARSSPAALLGEAEGGRGEGASVVSSRGTPQSPVMRGAAITGLLCSQEKGCCRILCDCVGSIFSI